MSGPACPSWCKVREHVSDDTGTVHNGRVYCTGAKSSPHIHVVLTATAEWAEIEIGDAGADGEGFMYSPEELEEAHITGLLEIAGRDDLARAVRHALKLAGQG